MGQKDRKSIFPHSRAEKQLRDILGLIHSKAAEFQGAELIVAGYSRERLDQIRNWVRQGRQLLNSMGEEETMRVPDWAHVTLGTRPLNWSAPMEKNPFISSGPRVSVADVPGGLAVYIGETCFLPNEKPSGVQPHDFGPGFAPTESGNEFAGIVEDAFTKPSRFPVVKARNRGHNRGG